MPTWQEVEHLTLCASLAVKGDEGAIRIMYRRATDLYIVMESRGEWTDHLHFKSVHHCSDQDEAAKVWADGVAALQRDGWTIKVNHVELRNPDKITDIRALNDPN